MSETINESQDSLPDYLDITKYVVPYQFPTPRKRRTAALSILVISVACLVIGIYAKNTSMVFGGSFFIFVGAFFVICGWPLNVKDLDALTSTATQAPFSVGHASAQLSFTGWLSKPVWRVVVFSSDEPPSQRGLVEINAVSKEIISTYFDHEGDRVDA